MKGYLVDTNVLSELRRPQPSKAVVQFLESCSLDQLHVSEVTLAEIRYGAETYPDADGRVRILAWLDAQLRPMFAGRVLATNEDIWMIWKAKEEGGRRRRYTFPQPDLVIAATALHHTLTVLSRDVEPFEQAGAKVLDPFVAQDPG